MRTYYDGRTWVTIEDGGLVIRQATLGEALAANQQAQAPPGVPMPDPRITVQNARIFDGRRTLPAQPDLAALAAQTAIGRQTTAASQKAAADKAAAQAAAAPAAPAAAASQPAVAATSVPAAAPAAAPAAQQQARVYSDLYGRWLANDQYNRSGQATGHANLFGDSAGNTTTNQDIYWNSAAGMHDAFDKAIAGVAEPDSLMARWLGQRYDEIAAAHNNASLTDLDRKFTDTLNMEMPKLVQRYFN